MVSGHPPSMPMQQQPIQQQQQMLPVPAPSFQPQLQLQMMQQQVGDQQQALPQLQHHQQQQQQQQPQQHTPQTSHRGPGYSRKEKSLGLLCDNFLRTYDGSTIGTYEICLDEAASRLDVERRRIYDIVNVLESVGVVTRKQKNSYTWNGLNGLPAALQQLQAAAAPAAAGAAASASPSQSATTEGAAAGPGEATPSPWGPGSVGTPGSAARTAGGPSENGTSAAAGTGRGARYTRKDKSLGLLSKRFIQMFLTSEQKIIALDDAAAALLDVDAFCTGGTSVDDKQLKTKVRRLYDIANVLASLRLVEKTQQPDTRKPAFRWRGAPAPGQPQYGGAGGAQPGGPLPAHAGGAGGSDRLQTLLLEGAESQSEPGSMTASPSPLGASPGGKRDVAPEYTNGHLGKRQRPSTLGANGAQWGAGAQGPPSNRNDGSGSYSPPETSAAGMAGMMHGTASTPPPFAGANAYMAPAGGSSTGPQPLAGVQAGISGGLQLPPSFGMAGMPMPFAMPGMPMMPPPGFPMPVPGAPGFSGSMAPNMQQLTGLGATGATMPPPPQLPPVSAAGSDPAAQAALQQNMMTSYMHFCQYWMALTQQQQALAAQQHAAQQTTQQQVMPPQSQQQLVQGASMSAPLQPAAHSQQPLQQQLQLVQQQATQLQLAQQQLQHQHQQQQHHSQQQPAPQPGLQSQKQEPPAVLAAAGRSGSGHSFTISGLADGSSTGNGGAHTSAHTGASPLLAPMSISSMPQSHPAPDSLGEPQPLTAHLPASASGAGLTATSGAAAPITASVPQRMVSRGSTGVLAAAVGLLAQRSASGAAIADTPAQLPMGVLPVQPSTSEAAASRQIR